MSTFQGEKVFCETKAVCHISFFHSSNSVSEILLTYCRKLKAHTFLYHNCADLCWSPESLSPWNLHPWRYS